MKRISPTYLYHSETTTTTSFSVKAGLIFLLSIWINHYAVAQSRVQQSKLQDRITAVENNLTENIQLNDAKAMNLQQRMKFYKIKGLSIAVIKDYKIDFVKSYGLADSALGIPVSEKTLFQAASISKSLNGLALVRLFNDRNLDLNADINEYLKSWKFPYDSLSKGKKISLSNLLSHTAGLSTSGFSGYEIGKPLPSITQILNGESPANSGAVRSKFAPGQRQQYSGGGVTISQCILTDITGEPYEKYLTEQVLRPLGMTSSTFAQPPTRY
jgi:CubicO group peptidase (beta-lactamase class C family)